MMGQQPKTESLFYYCGLQDQVPEGHLLRLIDRYIDFSFVRERLKDSYSRTGRPSVDPEVLLRLLLVGYLYGISSERRLLEEVKMHLAYRWFTRLGFEQEVPDHSTFSKNWHGRFRRSGVFREVFEEIVRRCLQAGLVEGRNLAVDGTLVQANASEQSRVPREQLVEAAQVSRTVREYLTELERQNPVGDPGRAPDGTGEGIDHRSGCGLGRQGWTGDVGLLRQLSDRHSQSSDPSGGSHAGAFSARDGSCTANAGTGREAGTPVPRQNLIRAKIG